MRKSFKYKLINFYTLLAIFILGIAVRLNGFNWDQNQHLHPDERFLTMVTMAIKIPASITDYLTPNLNPMNPYNAGFDFFVYGSLPTSIVKISAEIIHLDTFNYNNITLVGRLLSLVVDIGIAILVYKIASCIFDAKTAVFSLFIYFFSTLPIQLSHFFASDPYVVFFLTLTFYFLVKTLKKQTHVNFALCGLFFAAALASKVSAALFLPFVLLTFSLLILKKNKILKIVSGIIIFGLTAYLALRILDPHIFEYKNFINPTPSVQFLSNLKQLKSLDNRADPFPPAVQWLTTKPITYSFSNLVLWGIGLPFGALAVISMGYFSYTLVNQHYKKLPRNLTEFAQKLPVVNFSIFLIIGWIVFVFVYQSVQFAKATRYFYPILPFLALISGAYLNVLTGKLAQRFGSKTVYAFLIPTAILLLIWPLSFVQIYSRPHSRVSASRWIYQNLPVGSIISCEYWDDCLPLNLGISPLVYKTEILNLYDPDTPQKWAQINSQLAKIDYLILSSNRLWGSITKVPDKYPVTSMFYTDLFSGKTDFKLMAKFASYPTIPILNLPINDSASEESLTVYDHPEVYIFKNTKKILFESGY